MPEAIWKDNWDDTRRRFVDFWEGKGFLVGSWPGVRAETPHADAPEPPPPESLQQQWTDLDYRAAATLHQAAHTRWPLETLPVCDPWLGPGSMALYLGSEPTWQPDTVWYEPCNRDPDHHPPIAFDPANPWWQLQLELTDRLIDALDGRALVGRPDMVENWDILASLRGTEQLLADMLDRPAWVRRSIDEITEAWFACYDVLHDRLAAQGGGICGWFRTWAPGKVAKVQCDGAAMFSPAMFRQFVVPALTAQCQWLDRSLFHLDGSQCLGHLDALLEIEPLTAIEWTPDPKAPTGGSPHWYDMYRRILAAGKRVQVLGAAPEEIAPLLDAVGADGIYFLSFFATEPAAERYQQAVEKLR